VCVQRYFFSHSVVYTTDSETEESRREKEQRKRRSRRRKRRDNNIDREKKEGKLRFFFSIDINFLGMSLGVADVMKETTAAVCSCKSNDILQ
jgi:hypothetical protein